MSKPGNEVSKYRWAVLTVLIASVSWIMGAVLGFLVGCM